MDSVRSLGGVLGPMQVGERNGGRSGGGEAFRQQLERQQQDGDAPAGDAATTAEPPLPATLQSPATAGRKKSGDGRHVDVFA